MPAGEVRRIRVSELTNMPANYGEILTFQQVADLIASLVGLRDEPRAGAKAAAP